MSRQQQRALNPSSGVDDLSANAGEEGAAAIHELEHLAEILKEMSAEEIAAALVAAVELSARDTCG